MDNLTVAFYITQKTTKLVPFLPKMHSNSRSKTNDSWKKQCINVLTRDIHWFCNDQKSIHSSSKLIANSLVQSISDGLVSESGSVSEDSNVFSKESAKSASQKPNLHALL